MVSDVEMDDVTMAGSAMEDAAAATILVSDSGLQLDNFGTIAVSDVETEDVTMAASAKDVFEVSAAREAVASSSASFA